MDRLLDVEGLVASAVGASSACIYIADYAQQSLSPMGGTGAADAIAVDATVHGRVFETGRTHAGDGRVIAAMVEASDRVGVVECTFDCGRRLVDLVDAICRVLLLVLVSKRRYTDLVLRARRVRPLSTAAEMHWDLLPPLSGQASGDRIRRHGRTGVFDGWCRSSRGAESRSGAGADGPGAGARRARDGSRGIRVRSGRRRADRVRLGSRIQASGAFDGVHLIPINRARETVRQLEEPPFL